MTAACDAYPPDRLCPDGVSSVSVDEPLQALGGETPRERFEKAGKSWECTATWLALPEAYATQEPAPGTSPLELTLELTGESARYVKYPMSREEKYEATECRPAVVFVPCSLRLATEDGALDETLDAELELERHNTLVSLQLDAYEFSGTHATTFAEGIEPDHVELSLAFTPGTEPTRVDGAVIEAGKRSRGANPMLTTALVECTTL